MSEERKTNATDPKKVEKNHLMAFTYWAKVKEVRSNGEALIICDLDNGNTEIQVTGKELVARAYSADQYAEEEKVGKTKAAELLVSSPNRPFTVCFEKQDGTERVLKGRLVQPEPLLGRSMVEDLEATDPKGRLRQVDHRTIKYLIVDGVKYTVK